MSTVLGFTSCDEDNTNPVVVVNNEDYRVPLGGTYEEQGAMATDREEGVLSSDDIVIDDSQVRTDTVAEFEVKYFIVDAAGNGDSVSRIVPVYAAQGDYVGTWNVEETCDTITQNYMVEMTADPEDSLGLIVSNFRNRTDTFQVKIQSLGDLGARIRLQDTLFINDSVSVYTYDGTGDLLIGDLTQLQFEISFTEQDTVGIINCDAVFSKP
jgi:hypothetical protein